MVSMLPRRLRFSGSPFDNKNQRLSMQAARSISPEKLEKKRKNGLIFMKSVLNCHFIKSGCSAAWLARLSGGQKVASSNLAIPTIFHFPTNYHISTIYTTISYSVIPYFSDKDRTFPTPTGYFFRNSSFFPASQRQF